MKRMLKRLGMLIIGFVGIFFTIFFSNDMMHFLSANTKAGSIYNIGDTVIFGKESFTYIGDDESNLLLLGESSIGDNKTWNDANTIANNYRNSFGNIGKTVSVSSLASTNDLLQVGTTGTDSSGNTVITALDASIPQLPGNWWLKDDDLSSKKLARFLSAQNKREGYQSYQKYTPAIGGVCQAPTNAQTEVGTGFIKSFSDGGGDASSFLSSAKYRFKIQYIRGNTTTIKRYPRSTCVESEADKFDYLVGDVRENNIRFSQSSNNGPMNLEGKPLISVLFVPGNIFDGGVAAPNFTVTGLSVGWSKTVTFKQGVCYQLSSSTSSMNIASIGDDGIYRYGFQVGGKPGGSATVKFTLVDIIDPIYSTTTCPAVTTPAMTMSTRPLMKLPLDKILTYHNAKPTYALSTKLTGKQPVSDTSGSRPYLTMMSNAMNVNLDASDPGVKGTILSLKYPTSSTLIDLPLTFSGAKEGTRYLAASATDINGKEVYNVLDVISSDKQSVSVDYQNLLKDGGNSFQLTLYVIDDGVGDTSYRSNGTTITVRLKDDQAIDFDKLYNKATVEYGSELELHANLTSDVNKQSSSDLVFSIPSDSRGKYQIIKQSYDKTTGEAKVTIRPLTAGTNAKISISKSGDLFYFDAEERTMNLNFTKKELIVHPSVIEGKTIGDAMPNILSESSELAFSDTIPDALSPYLERTSPLIAEDPDVAGIIQNPGTWKLLYHADVLNGLGDFTDKYNVILEDYRDDTKYVFAVDPNGIPDGWIEISPQPNNNGWNNTDVKVKPSNEAIYFGYHSITDGNQEYDVYLKLGDKVIQPSQSVKVYLPYENPSKVTYLYEVNEKNKVKEIKNQQENGYLIFETKTLEKYAISDETQKTNVNIDTDNDGKPDINIDVDCDGQADINIDTDGDNKPDINIDTTGDGKPNYNIDIDQDNEPDINIGPIEWKPNKCQTSSCGKEYCTSTYYKPYLNIDTDDDGRADVNLDLNKDKIADLNIDIDQDYIPDIEIDINGDAKADINIDTNGDGRPEKNLAIIQEWKPDLNVDSPMKYDTMSNIKVDESLTPDTWKPSKNAYENNHPLNNKVNNSAQGGAITGEMNKAFYLWMMFIVSACILFIIHSYKKRKCL